MSTIVNDVALTSFISFAVTQTTAAYAIKAETAGTWSREFNSSRTSDYASADSVFHPIEFRVNGGKGMVASTSPLSVVGRSITLTPENNVYTYAITADQLRIAKDFVGGSKTFAEDPSRFFKNGEFTTEGVTVRESIGFNIGQKISADIEKSLTDALNVASFYCPFATYADAPTMSDWNMTLVNKGRSMMRSLDMAGVKRYGAFNIETMEAITDSVQNQYNLKFNNPALEKGVLAGSIKSQMMDFQGITSFTDPSITPHTPGPQYAINPDFTVSALVPDPNAPTGAMSFSAITVTGVASTTGLLFKKNDAFSITTVNPIAWLYGRTLSQTFVFKAAADVYGDGAGNATIPLHMTQYLTGVYTNLSASPAIGAAVSMWGPRYDSFLYYPKGLVCSSFRLADYRIPDKDQFRFSIGKFDMINGVQTVVRNGTTDSVYRCAFAELGMSELIVWMPTRI